MISNSRGGRCDRLIDFCIPANQTAYIKTETDRPEELRGSVKYDLKARNKMKDVCLECPLREYPECELEDGRPNKGGRPLKHLLPVAP